ncbi:DNA-binding transcriptional regulator, FrmR family [Amphibacillus marinus]|uniref:DNA-binding transcriptional regulator, FrmR family n=1 Tax=Amphibacillus marinus TaxID=872970 RepID=A0A1H8RWJ1_9BACI|nr:metal-sensing transcriptional repressor [Amphibacillus marinus]SEO70821.1 DNA-binding transcriptional regulator, FrmR family [Amphibacillus marinus]
MNQVNQNSTRHSHHRTEQDKQKLLTRLKKIEGQVRGIQKMVIDDRYCVDIMVQISAINAALKKVGFTMMEDHVNHCVSDAIQDGTGEASVAELIKVVKQFSK